MSMQPHINEQEPSVAEGPSHRTDAILGVVVSLLGTGILVGALAMPRFENRSADPLTVPGITPGLLGAILLVLGLLLALRGLRRQGSEGPLDITQWAPDATKRTLFTLAALLIYGFGLFGNVPFIPATAVFVFCFTVGVEWIRADRKSSMTRTVLGAAALAVISSLVIWAVFSRIFLIQLPG